MKVAVISNLETQQGRSSFIVLLASLFARTQHRRVTIFSTGNMDRLLDTVDVKDATSSVKSISVLRAMISTASMKDEDFYDYALRVGEEEVFAYNVMASSIDKQELEEMLLILLDKVKSDLTLIEVTGSIENDFNKQVLKSCDAILNVFNHSTTSMKAVTDYIENYDADIVTRTGYVCQKFDSNAIGEKKIGTLVKMNARNIMTIPYNSVVCKESIDGTLNTLAKFIATGHNEVVSLRIKLLEVMQFLFDSPSYKYIKGVNEWHKY